MKRILVIKLGALGDFFAASSAFEKIRQQHMNDHLTLLTTPPYFKIGHLMGYFNEIMPDERPKLTQLTKAWNLRKRLLEGKFDRVYDLQMVDRTNVYCQLSRLCFNKSPEWVGTAWGASHPYSLPKKPTYHQTRLEGLLAAGNIAPPLPALNLTRLAGNLQDFPVKTPYVFFAPGASAAHRERKCWPLVHYASIGRQLVVEGFTPVIVGAPDEDNRLLTGQCRGAIDLTGKTSIEDLVTLSTHAAFAIGSDTGPMHIAAACLCPVLVLFFGDTNPQAGGPRGQFYRHIHAHSRQSLAPETVLAAIPEFIQEFRECSSH